MKKYLLNYSTALLLVIIASVANAQTRTATTSGNWNNIATWGGQQPPTSANAVVINNGINVTVNVADASCASLTITGGDAPNTLTISGTNSLTVTGAVSIGAPSDGSSDKIIAVGTGSLTCGSLTMGNPGTGDDDCILSLSTGTVTVTGNITMSGSNSENFITFTGAGTLNAGGSISGGTITPSTGTVNFDGGTQTIPGYTYNNLTASGTNTKTVGDDLAISGNLLVESGATLSLGNNDIEIDVNANRSVTINGTVNINGSGRLTEGSGGTKTLVINDGGFLNLTAGGTTLPVLNAYNFSANSTVVFGSTGAQTVENSVTYGNLTVSGGNTKTLESSGGTMTFQGNITIAASTTLNSNNKTMNVAGAFTNNGTFTIGTSTVNLNGAAQQVISGSVATTPFYNLTINNSAGAKLDVASSIANTLTLTNGIILVETATLVINSGAGVTGAKDASFVDGKVRKVGNTGFTFPVGKTGVGYMQIAIASITGGNATTSFEAQYFRASARATFDTTGIYALGIQAISNCEYWRLDRTNTSASANVTLSWNAHSPCGGSYLVDPLIGIRIVHYSTTLSKWDASGGVGVTGNASAGSITWAGVSNFSPFALGAAFGSTSPLPVMFADVKAYQHNSGVQIEWSNLTERDLIKYVVERSANGQTFTALGEQLPRSNNNDKESYTSFDASPLSGVNFYRVKVFEIGGKIVYSKVLKVEIGSGKGGFTLYPNPTTGGQVSLSMNVKQGQYTVKVLNSAGQQVYGQRLNHQGGMMSQTVDLSSVKPGIYNMVIAGDNYRESKTFIVQ